MMRVRRIGYSTNEDTGETQPIWQCEICGHVWLEKMPPRECPACVVMELMKDE